MVIRGRKVITAAYADGFAASPPRKRRRAGFTLLELLLVLGVLILVTAIAYPSLEAWYEGYRLQEAVDKVREVWIRGRTLAMNEGRPYRFAFILNAGGYRLAPDDFENWPELVGSPAGPRQSGIGFALGRTIEEDLPEGVIFYNWEEAQTAFVDTSSGWSREAIVFWPDGTARLAGQDGVERTETLVVIRDRHGRSRSLHLRAMTGVISVQNH